MGERAPAQRRRPVGLGTVWFASACVAASVCLVATGSMGAGAEASAIQPGPHHGAVALHTVVDTSHQVSSRYWGNDDSPPAPRPSTPAPAAPPAAALPAAAPVPAPPPPAPPPAPPVPPAPPAPSTAPTTLPARGAATASGCAAALAYLAAYAAPGFTFECPGPALGHQAMTCIDEPGVCESEHLIAIADPCAAAYMNEASNSWVLTGASDAPIDPYGPCA